MSVKDDYSSEDYYLASDFIKDSKGMDLRTVLDKMASMVAKARRITREATLREFLPTCSGDWLDSSSGERRHSPCNHIATWVMCDGKYNYCDNHVPEHEKDSRLGYTEPSYAALIREEFNDD